MVLIPKWILDRVGENYDINVTNDTVIRCHIIKVISKQTGKSIIKELPFDDVNDFCSHSFGGTIQGAYEALVSGLIGLMIQELEAKSHAAS